MHVLISIYIPDLHKYEQKQFMYNMKCTKNDLLVSNLLMKNNLSILYVDDDILFVKDYSVSHNFIPPSKELCSKMALGEVDVSLQ